jgi:hypothetical protein
MTDNGTYQDDDWQAELAQYAERMRMCLAEAGYPLAEVRIEPTGVFVDGAPWDVAFRAGEIANGR